METQAARLPPVLEGAHIHFVGIKGTGMAALVEILHQRGVVITGSDVAERFYTDDILERLGIQALPFGADNITDDVALVVYSSAYSPEKAPDLSEAARRGIPMLLYSEALGAVSAAAYGCGICGVHGKTTTTGITGTLLRAAGLPSQTLAGSAISSFGGSCTVTVPGAQGEPPRYFVAETCEYQRHFMAFHPRKIVLTSVESDHQDYYPAYADILAAFVDYICLLPRGGQLIYCADDAGASEAAALAAVRRPDIALVPYGEQAEGDYRLTFGSISGGRRHFAVAALGECALAVPGDHAVRDACAALALCRELLREDGRDPAACADALKAGLLEFTGGRRRSEVIGHAFTPAGQDVIIIDDYGHHPTAIKTTLAGYRAFYRGRRIVVDFMSHTYSRTAALLDDFAASFADADDVIINKIYGSAREDPAAAPVSGRLLAARASTCHPHVAYRPEFDGAADFVLELLSGSSGDGYPEGWLVVTMGAGDNWKVGRLVQERLARQGGES